MVSTNQLSPMGEYAKMMVKSVAENSASKRTHIRQFFRQANSDNAQGTALINYFTELNKIKYAKNLSTDKFKRLSSISEVIENEAKEVPAIREEASKFTKALKDNYPKTLSKRVSILSQGAVVADEVKPTSKFKKFMFLLNQLINEG